MDMSCLVLAIASMLSPKLITLLFLTSGDQKCEHKTYSDTVAGTESIVTIVIASFHQLNTGLHCSNKTRHLQQTAYLSL